MVAVCETTDQQHSRGEQKMESVRGCVVSWRSRRIRRVTTSTFAAETVQALAGFDVAASVRDMVLEVFGVSQDRILLKSNTDCLSLVEHIKSLRVSVSEWRLKGDISALKEAVLTGEMEMMSHISEADNVADGLTKPKAKLKWALMRAMGGIMAVPVSSLTVARRKPGAWQEEFMKI